MAIQELEVFPQFTTDEHNGVTGVRKWALDHDDNILKFMKLVCESHWPRIPDCLPVRVQMGPHWDGAVIRNTQQDAGEFPRTTVDIGSLPNYSKYLVVAEYALHRLTNCWPIIIPKPYHPPGTTMNLRIRGGGQVIILVPAGVKAGQMQWPTCGVNEHGAAINNAMITRVIIPVSEYHVTCDRMTKSQLDYALGTGVTSNWDRLLGSVNTADVNPRLSFLGAPAGTLLFDGYELTETMVADVIEPRRYRLTAVFKKRVLTDDLGNIKTSGLGTDASPLRVVDWNHDYINVPGAGKSWQWLPITMQDGVTWSADPAPNGTTTPICKWRYPAQDFSDLFGDSGLFPQEQDCGTDIWNPATSLLLAPILDDDAVCDPVHIRDNIPVQPPEPDAPSWEYQPAPASPPPATSDADWPCVIGTCSGDCTYMWDETDSVWLLIDGGCMEGCNCPEPTDPGGEDGEIQAVLCEADPGSGQ